MFLKDPPICLLLLGAILLRKGVAKVLLLLVETLDHYLNNIMNIAEMLNLHFVNKCIFVTMY